MRSKKHKYGATKTRVGNLTFSSRLEASVYQLLKLRERAGEVENIQCQVTVTLKEKCPTCGDEPLRWKVDFSYWDPRTNSTVYVEAKGLETNHFKKQKKWFKTNRIGKLEIWKGSHEKPYLSEVIE